MTWKAVDEAGSGVECELIQRSGDHFRSTYIPEVHLSPCNPALRRDSGTSDRFPPFYT